MKTILSTVALLGSVALVAGQACTVPAATCANPTTGPYVAEPCFPNTGVCYPTNYYAATDQGQFNGANGDFATQLAASCQITCSAQQQCLSFVGVFYKAADSNLATGTCFYYNVAQVFPRQCADAPSGIVAQYKQQTCPASAVTTTSSTVVIIPPTTTFAPITTPTTTTPTTTSPAVSISTITTSSTSVVTSGTIIITVTISGTTTTISSASSSTTSLTTLVTLTTTTSTISSPSSSSTSTTITSPAAPITTIFIIASEGSSNVADGTTLNDAFNGGPDNEGFGLFDNSNVVFGLDANSYLVDTTTGNYANVALSEPAAIYFDSMTQIALGNYVYCTGALDGSNNLQLNCGGLTVPQTDGNGVLWIGTAVDAGYSAVTLATTPA